MGIILLVIVGAAAGLFATHFMRVRTDLITTVAIGVLGALVGGLPTLIMLVGWAAGFVGAVLGAMLLIWLWERYGGRFD